MVQPQRLRALPPLAEPAPKKRPQDRGKPREGTFSRAMIDALLDGDTFTGPEAYNQWGVWSVSSLINNLRHAGWQIGGRRDSETGRTVYYLVRRRKLRDGLAYHATYGLALPR